MHEKGHPSLLSIYIIICTYIFSTFSGNQVDKSVVQGIQEDNPEAAVYAFQFPLRFTGTNQLHDNTGGGLSATSSVVKVDGTLLVHNNTANYGGGIHLEDHSLVWSCFCMRMHASFFCMEKVVQHVCKSVCIHAA